MSACAAANGWRCGSSTTARGWPLPAQPDFRTFFTTRSQGTGLGLAVVQSVVRAHQGEVSVASVPGEGTCFTLSFPCISNRFSWGRGMSAQSRSAEDESDGHVGCRRCGMTQAAFWWWKMTTACARRWWIPPLLGGYECREVDSGERAPACPVPSAL